MSRYRTALVTGASRGIGAAIVRRLRALDLTVYAAARDGAALAALAAECGAHPLVADVTAPERLVAALGDVEIDVLINNAGAVPVVAPVHLQSAEQLDAALDLNLRAPLHLMRLLLPGMVERRCGHVINIGSTAGAAVFPGTAVYAGAKAGLSQATRVLRYDLAGSNVRVTEIAPGRVETQVYLESYGGDAARLHETMYAGHRALQPEDLAETVALALSLPERADVSFLEISPTDQAPGGHIFPRRDPSAT